MVRSLVLSLAAAALTGCSTSRDVFDITPGLPPGDMTRGGAVTAADPRAEAAGTAMLAAGGNAVDAAIAVMLALTVVEPQSSGIGGGGFLVRGTADGAVTTIDGRETAPAGAGPDWFLAPDGTVPPYRASVASGLSVGVPGNIALAYEAHRRFGALPWAELFAPAIRLAEDGFVMNPRLNRSLADNAALLARAGPLRTVFLDAEGAPLPVGTTIRNPVLAATLRRLAKDGPQAFYDGPLAAEIARTVAADTPRAGAMTTADIAAYAAKPRDAVCAPYRAYRVCTMGPPTSGGVAVLQMLGQLERFDLSTLGAGNPAVWHLFLESQRLAYADRERYLADSDYVTVPVAGLLDPEYIARRSALIDPGSTIAVVRAGTPAGAAARADGTAVPEQGTSHLGAVDGAGTMVSYTSTIEGPFGSGLTAGGFFLNNELTDFSRTPEVDGVVVANRVEGGKRPRSSMSPVIVYDPAGRPFMVAGAAGGSTIPVQTARSIIGVIDFGLDAGAAMALPFVMAMGDRVMVEEGPRAAELQAGLAALGHPAPVVRAAPLKAGMLLRRNDRWTSARDPRIAAQLVLP